MKKVESFIGVDGIHRQWNEIKDSYYNDILNGRAGYISPLGRLNAILGNRHRGQRLTVQERNIVNYLRGHFEEIIKDNILELENKINLFDNNGWSPLIYNQTNKTLTQFGKKIQKAFRYDYLRSNRIVRLASMMNVKACLYCNSQYTIVVWKNNKQLANFQYDHFFPKSIYPYLIISISNLIPSCPSCNLHKGSMNERLANFVHPYHEDFHFLTGFSINERIQVRLLFGDIVGENEFKISLTNLNTNKVRKYNDFFALEGIYNRHKDIVIEIFRKAYAYRHGGKEALIALRNHDGNPLFATEDEIEWLLLANFTNVEDINRRPLAKFMQDIAVQAGLLRGNL